jgi:D-isomer specific 2-hydroxyacid dehydrogenase, NAD binding domain/Aldehyde dehydrogenase family
MAGKVVAHAAAENLTPVLLELGGQNPALVDDTANIPDAAKKTVWGATAWGGQWCTSPGYAYVQESIADAFVSEAKKAVVELYGRDPKNNPDYSRIISAKELALMKPTARLVNTSRGPIVVEADLLAALRNGKIAGAAIDVFDQEPLPLDHPFRGQANLLATPHIGYVSRGLYARFYKDTVDNIRQWLDARGGR